MVDFGEYELINEGKIKALVVVIQSFCRYFLEYNSMCSFQVDSKSHDHINALESSCRPILSSRKKFKFSYIYFVMHMVPDVPNFTSGRLFCSEKQNWCQIEAL